MARKVNPQAQWPVHESPIYVNRFSATGRFFPEPGNSTFEAHHHDFHELVCIHTGRATHEVESITSEVGPGDVFLIRPGMTHRFADATDLSLTNVMFISWRLTAVLEELAEIPGFASFYLMGDHDGHALPLAPSAADHVRELTDRMLLESERQWPGFKTSLRGLLAELLVVLGRTHTGEPAPRADAGLAQLVSLLQARFNQPWTLEQMAEIAACSTPTLVRRMRERFAQSPTDYLLSLRIRHAQRLLIHTDLPVTRIAEQTGFCDSNYLSRQFRKRVGLSPREFRAAADAR